MARNGVIGKDNGLPWHLPADLKHFKATTLGKPILMGRKTYQSIGKPLPGRTNIVLTRDARWSATGTVVVGTLPEALRVAADAPELAVIGGAEVFRLFLPVARRLHLTRILADFDGDTFFPPLDEGWIELARRDYAPDAANAYAMQFVTLERSRPVRAESPR